MPTYQHLGGVYRLDINKFYYIGTTSNFTTRFQYHLIDLQEHKHTNPKLQNLYNADPSQKITFTKLHECDDPERSILERELIIKHKSDPYCLNINIPGAL